MTINLKKKQKSSFLSNISTLVIGTTFAQVLGILVSPILTRLYGPESFGIFAIFLSISTIITVIICLRYECAIILPESDNEAANILALCSLFIILITVFSTFILMFGKTFIIHFLNVPDLGVFFYLLPVTIFFSGFLVAFNYWYTRKKNFARLTTNRVVNSVTVSGTQLGLGFSGNNTVGGLIYANVIGQSVSSLYLGIMIWRENQKLFIHSINRKAIFDSLKRYKDFPLYDSWAELLNAISWQLPVFFLAAFFSPIIVGFYSLGYRIIQFPMSFIGNSIAQVFYPQAVEAKFDGTLKYLVENFFNVLVIIGMFPILVLTIIGSDLFVVVFGEQWREAGLFAQILSIWAFFWFISSPLSSIYYVFEKQKEFLYLTITNLITRFLSLFIGCMLGSVYIALGLFAVSGIIVYGYLCFIVMKYSGISWTRITKILLPNFIIFIPFGIFLGLLKIFNTPSLLLVGISSLIIIGYYIYLIKKNDQIKSILRQIEIINKFI